MSARLSDEARAAALAELSQWSMVTGREAIARSFRFPDFRRAFAFMTEVALLAEKMDHHPEWFNVYDRVDVTLATHDVGGLSERDLRMARAMDAMARRHGV